MTLWTVVQPGPTQERCFPCFRGSRLKYGQASLRPSDTSDAPAALKPSPEFPSPPVSSLPDVFWFRFHPWLRLPWGPCELFCDGPWRAGEDALGEPSPEGRQRALMVWLRRSLNSAISRSTIWRRRASRRGETREESEPDSDDDLSLLVRKRGVASCSDPSASSSSPPSLELLSSSAPLSTSSVTGGALLGMST